MREVSVADNEQPTATQAAEGVGREPCGLRRLRDVGRAHEVVEAELLEVLPLRKEEVKRR